MFGLVLLMTGCSFLLSDAYPGDAYGHVKRQADGAASGANNLGFLSVADRDNDNKLNLEEVRWLAKEGSSEQTTR